MNALWLRGLTALGAVLVLGAVNVSIAGKEHIRRDGEVVYLELAPLDPRSLMQGDYMALRFALAQALEQQIQAQRVASADAGPGTDALREGTVAYAAVSLTPSHVARLADAASPGKLKLRYRIRHGAVWLGTNAFFFEEGSAERYNGARYGEFRVDRESGEAVLMGLRGGALEKL